MASIVVVTPTITAAAYTSGNQLGGIQTLQAAGDGVSMATDLLSVTVTDKAGQNAAIDLFFFNALPTVTSTDKVAINIPVAELAAKGCGIASFAASDYKLAGTGSMATQKQLYILMRPATAGTLYVVPVVRGTPTYASTSDLTFTYCFTWGN